MGPRSKIVRRNRIHVPDFRVMTIGRARYLHFFAAAYRIESQRREAIVRDVLALTDLTEKTDAPVDALSRGMKQRLGLARVLLHDPDLLLLDEPASGLDPRARIEMRELLKELQSMGKTILVSSHILHELGQLCTSIGIVEAGEMVACGSLQEIYRALVCAASCTSTGQRLPGLLPKNPGNPMSRIEEHADRSRCSCERTSAASRICSMTSRAARASDVSAHPWIWTRRS